MEGRSLDSLQLLEEVERLQHEFGKCKIQIPDSVERWWYDVTRVEFDSEAQAIRLVSDA
jgi:hypothetical protein